METRPAAWGRSIVRWKICAYCARRCDPRMDDRASAGPSAGLSGAGLRLFALGALAAIILGRALDAALPGSVAGIATLIALVDRVSALASQAVALLGSLLVM